MEVRAVVGRLVVLDNGDAGDEEEQGDEVEAGVDALAEPFLGGGAGGLQGQDGLYEDEDGQRLKQWVGGEEDEAAAKDRGPDEDDEDEGADLGERAGA